MSRPGVERRRAPRVTPEGGRELSLETSIPVQVLDISQSGVLLASKFALAVGDRAELRTTIGSESVSVPIEVCRVTVETNVQAGMGRYRGGAVFGPMSLEQRVLLEQLLGAEPT